MKKQNVESDGLKEYIREFIDEENIKDCQISYETIKEYDRELAEEFKRNPFQAFHNTDIVLSNVTGIQNSQTILTDYNERKRTVRGLRDKDLNTLVKIDGVISQATSVKPKADIAVFTCDEGHTTKVQQPMTPMLEYPRRCSNQDCNKSSQRSFKLNSQATTKMNFQKLELQEPQEQITGRETPQSITVNIRGNLAGTVTTGDRVSITGIYKVQSQEQSSIFDTYILGRNIEMEEEELDDLEITTDEEQSIKNLAQQDDIYETLTQSIAPSLYGLTNEKRAILYQLFRGVRKTDINTRGDIHILLVGDPGCGKSALLRYASKLSPRSVMTSGKGASGAGLTVSAVRDSDFGGDDNWTLKAGAMVLADEGVACIDELDKMDASDRSSMLECLEQQTISVNKAGINATLQSRCSLLGAANPSDGRWNDIDSVPQQIDLQPALVSRFDLIFAPKDTQDNDKELAEHIITSNVYGQKQERNESAEESVTPEISPKLFRKYVAYARNNCQPYLTETAQQTLREYYVELRELGGENTVSITARKIEALIRLSESIARIQLSEKVKKGHAEEAIRIMQKSLNDVGYNKETDDFDIDMLESNQSSSKRNRKNRLLSVIDELQEEDKTGVEIQKITENMDDDTQKIMFTINKLKRESILYHPDKDNKKVDKIN